MSGCRALLAGARGDRRRSSRGALGVWIVRGPGPLDFAGGQDGVAGDYRAGNADRRAAPSSRRPSRDRARRVSGARPRTAWSATPARAAGHCCRRARLQAAVRHALFDQHHARQGDRHRQLHRRRISSTRCSAASGRDGAGFIRRCRMHVLHLHDRCRRAGDQGLSVQPAAGARGGAREHAVVPVQPALADGRLVGAVQSRQALQPDTPSAARNGTAARIWSRRWRIAANATRRATSAFALDNRKKFAGAVDGGLACLQHHAPTRRAASAAGATTSWLRYLSHRPRPGPRHGLGADGRGGRPQPQPARPRRHPAPWWPISAACRRRPRPTCPPPRRRPAPPRTSTASRRMPAARRCSTGACASCHSWSGESASLAGGDADRHLGRQRSRRDQRRPGRDLRRQAPYAGWRAALMPAFGETPIPTSRSPRWRQLCHRPVRRQRLEADGE